MSKPLLQIVPDAQNTRNYQFIRDTIGRLDSRFQQEVFWFAERRSLGGLYRSFLSFHRLLKKKSFALVHCQYGGVNLLLGLYAKLFFKTPLVVTFRGSDINNAKTLSSRISALTSRAFASLCDHVICVSRALSEKLFFVNPEKLSIIPSGVDTAMFLPMSQVECRQRLQLKANCKYILFSSGGRPGLKGQALVEAMFQIVKEKTPDAELLILSGTTDQTEMPLFMAAADCLVLASLTEGSPNVVKEAICCNLPVVSVDVGDVRHLLEGIAPSAVVERTPQAFAGQVVTILRECRRANGRSKADILSKPTEIARLSEVYTRLTKLEAS
jgi:glycosyltransferase involved in cell wall biosynthesis